MGSCIVKPKHYLVADCRHMNLEETIQAWIKEGRSEEQIYGVRNFFSGKGRTLIDEAHNKGIVKERMAWLRGERCHTCGNPMEHSPTSDTCQKCFEEA